MSNLWHSGYTLIILQPAQETTNQKDETGSTEIVLFSSVIDKISNNHCYDFKKNENPKF